MHSAMGMTKHMSNRSTVWTQLAENSSSDANSFYLGHLAISLMLHLLHWPVSTLQTSCRQASPNTLGRQCLERKPGRCTSLHHHPRSEPSKFRWGRLGTYGWPRNDTHVLRSISSNWPIPYVPWDLIHLSQASGNFRLCMNSSKCLNHEQLVLSKLPIAGEHDTSQTKLRTGSSEEPFCIRYARPTQSTWSGNKRHTFHLVYSNVWKSHCVGLRHTRPSLLLRSGTNSSVILLYRPSVGKQVDSSGNHSCLGTGCRTGRPMLRSTRYP